MKINIEELLTQGIKKTIFEEKLTDIDLVDAKLLSPAKIRLELDIFKDQVYIKGELNTEVELECVRCLEKFDFKLGSKFESVYTLKKSFEEEKQFTDDETEDLMMEVLADGSIDVKALIREQIILEIPPYPVCREDCEGLEEFEKYRDNGTDPRWQQLLDIANKK